MAPDFREILVRHGAEAHSLLAVEQETEEMLGEPGPGITFKGLPWDLCLLARAQILRTP